MGHELVKLHGRFLDGHGLKHDLSGAADTGVKQAFTAQENVLCAFDHFNIKTLLNQKIKQHSVIMRMFALIKFQMVTLGQDAKYVFFW